MLHFGTLKKKRKTENVIEPHRDPLPSHSIHSLADIADIARGMQGDDNQLGVEQEQDSALEFEAELDDVEMQIEFEADGNDEETSEIGAVVDDDEIEVKQLLADVQSASRSYRDKQRQLRAKWANIHEELAWELLSFQATEKQEELPPCECAERASKRVECIGLEGK